MFTQIIDDLTSSMKNQDKFKTSVLRMLKASLMNEKISKKDDLTDDEVLNIIKKQVKTREASKEEYIKYNRLDIADNLTKEIEILKYYLPEELDAAAISKIVDETITELKPEGMKDMGRVIKTIGSKYGTSVDMGLVSKLVKEKLS